MLIKAICITVPCFPCNAPYKGPLNAMEAYRKNMHPKESLAIVLKCDKTLNFECKLKKNKLRQ